MEPLTLAVGIAEILSLVTTAIRSAKKYHESVASAKSSISLLLTKLQALESALGKLNVFLASGIAETSGLQFDQTSVLLTCSSACRSKLHELNGKLEKARSGRFFQLRSPLDEGETKKAIEELGTFTVWI